MKLPILTTEGKDSGDNVELADSIFGIEPNETAIYEDVRRYMANQRQGTSNTKERGQVRGGGRKAPEGNWSGTAWFYPIPIIERWWNGIWPKSTRSFVYNV